MYCSFAKISLVGTRASTISRDPFVNLSVAWSTSALHIHDQSRFAKSSQMFVQGACLYSSTLRLRCACGSTHKFRMNRMTLWSATFAVSISTMSVKTKCNSCPALCVGSFTNWRKSFSVQNLNNRLPSQETDDETFNKCAWCTFKSLTRSVST